jgi:hypothetical protein
MIRSRALKLTGILILLTVCGCIYQGGTMYVAATGKPVWPPVAEHLLSQKQLVGSGLEIVWQNELPIKQDESVDRLVILGDKLCVLSSRNFLTVLNRSDGAVIFSRISSEPEFPVTGLGAYQDELFTIESRGLIEINALTGADIRVTLLDFTAACPAVRDSAYFYVAGTDRRIRAFRADDMVKMFEVGAPDDSAINSVVADERFAIFTTDTGRCISFDVNSPKYLWQFNAEGGIAPPIAQNGDSVFFASKDTYVYRFEAATGRFVWKCPMGERLQAGPVAVSKCVYQYSQSKGLAAIDRESGKILWRLPEALSLIAEAGDKAYLAAGVDGIIVMDNTRTGKQSGIGIPGASKYAVNVVDSKIYISDAMGRIACLKPTK